MENLPILSDNQVAILRAELKTGHVCDINFILATAEDQRVYSIFQNVNAAIQYINEIKASKKGLEFVIYYKDGKVIKMVTTD